MFLEAAGAAPLMATRGRGIRELDDFGAADCGVDGTPPIDLGVGGTRWCCGVGGAAVRVGAAGAAGSAGSSHVPIVSKSSTSASRSWDASMRTWAGARRAADAWWAAGSTLPGLV